MSAKGFNQVIFCKICSKRVLSSVWKMHVMGKKHLHYTPKKIRVTGKFDANKVDQVHQYFGQFGTIGVKKVTAGPGKVVIDYSFHDTRVHSKIIYKEHYFFNQKLKITWDEVKTPLALPFLKENHNKYSAPVKARLGGPTKRKVDKDHIQQSILKTLKEAETFTDEVLLLHSKLQANKKDIEKKKKLVHEDLREALSPMFALNTIYFFGSSVTGLDIQDSDLDIYVANVREDAKIKPEVSTLKLMRFLMFKCRKFSDIILIPKTRIPIIKCVHTKTQMSCDVNIRSKMAVCNSQLIRYYLTLDDKLRPLMLVIKFWAHCYDLKKVNLFSSYALYMMVIFYLQHEPYGIPSVKDLQKNIAPDLVEGWNCAFELKGFSSLALKNESIPNLVAGFFKFYSNFDYNSKVITPFYGAAIDKICFVEPVDLPDGYNEYFKNRRPLIQTAGMCIQDPFEHSRNVTSSVILVCTGKFAALCRTSLKLIQNAEKELLYKLLTQDPSFDYVFELEKPEDRDEGEWQQAVRDMTSRIMNEILNVTVSCKKDTNYYSCAGVQNIWQDRINIMKKLSAKLPADISDIDKEIATTKYIVKYLTQTLPSNFSMTMNFKQEPCRVEFILRPGSKKCKYHLHSSHFFATKLNRYLTAEENSGSGTIDMDTALADAFSTDRPHSSVMTHQDDNIGEDKKSLETSAGKHVRGASHDNQTSDEQANGGETSKLDEEEAHIEEVEEEEEDVPADFFDDFSNQDFMDGLDIVDAWDEDKLLEDSEDKPTERENDRQRRPHSPIRFSSKSPVKRRRQLRSRSRSLTRRHRRTKSPSQKRVRSRSGEKSRVSDRRDPEKTKRDINMDKMKCAKDREQKLVDDKLRIVETGLVPPGTEMETDISTILREKEKEKRRSTTGSSTEKKRELKPDREREKDRRYIKRSGSRELRKSIRHSPNAPLYRPRPREREPPYRPRKRTASVDSNLSDRELWIRSRKRSRSRSRESTLRRTKSKKYDEEKKKKKTFLEEIRDKLNETRTPLPPVGPSQASYNMVQYPNPIPHPIPAPVPAPGTQFFPSGPQQYDQSFFIGEGFPPNMMNQPRPVGFGMVANPGNVMQMPMPVQVQAPVQSPAQVPVPPAPIFKKQPLASPKINIFSDFTVTSKVEQKKESIEDISQLFADKKISLSDFLTITAKCEVQSSSPEHLQKKIKVISRCQDAIKAMTDDCKFNGRLCVKPSVETKNRTGVQYQSPLRRIPLVRFQFTTPAKTSEDSDNFSIALDKILQKIGLLKDTIDLDESVDPSKSKLSYSSFADEEAAALTMKAAFLNAKKTETKSECEECKKLKAKSFADVGSQCADTKQTVAVATQVTEEDLSPAKGMPKNASIAYLTPAQLLGKEKDKEREEEEKLQQSSPEKKVEQPLSTPPARRGKPKPTFKTRGATRKPLRGRARFNKYTDYDDYAYDDCLDFYEQERTAFDDPREDFERRFGGPSGTPRYPRQFIEEEPLHSMSRGHQFRDDEANFTDFTHPYVGRGGRFGSRY